MTGHDLLQNALGVLADKRVLVTGAGGFLGGHLGRMLHDVGIFVRAV